MVFDAVWGSMAVILNAVAEEAHKQYCATMLPIVLYCGICQMGAGC